jgi:hypothetical protein
MAPKIGLAPGQCREFIHTPRAGWSRHGVVALRCSPPTRRASYGVVEGKNTQMGEIYSRLREDHEALKRDGAWAGIDWSASHPNNCNAPVH